MSVVFSVITITYNAAPVLQRTLDSVARQTYKGVEHIIMDGASKDETVAMAEKYKEQSDQADNGHEVRILSEPDKGLYDAMNKGLRLATGDYIVYMNAGDIFALPKPWQWRHTQQRRQRTDKSLPCSMATPTSWMGKDASCDIEGCTRRAN